MAVEGAGRPDDAGAQRERLHLERDDALAGDRRHLIVVADRAEHAAVGRAPHALEEPERRGDEHGDDSEIDQVERLRRHAPAPRPRDPRDSVGPLGQPDLVAGDQAHHLREAERDNREVVAPEIASRQGHDGTGGRREERRGHEAHGDRQTELHGDERRGVRAGREEAREPEVDQPGHSPHEVQAERHEPVEAGKRQHRDEVVPNTRALRECRAAGASARSRSRRSRSRCDTPAPARAARALRRRRW